jgi:hypothetical protein
MQPNTIESVSLTHHRIFSLLNDREVDIVIFDLLHKLDPKHSMEDNTKMLLVPDRTIFWNSCPDGVVTQL